MRAAYIVKDLPAGRGAKVDSPIIDVHPIGDYTPQSYFQKWRVKEYDRLHEESGRAMEFWHAVARLFRLVVEWRSDGGKTGAFRFDGERWVDL